MNWQTIISNHVSCILLSQPKQFTDPCHLVVYGITSSAQFNLKFQRKTMLSLPDDGFT